ncbi:MAG: hypothetical protein J7500_14205 [Sphingomonas sp.]|uniref:hypothetical protein n=1 Tax=Sphingomonas sp. TaxID=28214 RepID=UPI001B0F3582|nr:hypothetical protein [Sphingomonas sp.]MBO9623857.1 hypothetical protein [Sphingomonas sp.]
MFKTLLAVCSVLTMAPVAALAAPDPVVLEGGVKLEKSVVENGVAKPVLVEPKVVVPGDRLLFTTRYANKGTQGVSNFVVTNPLPAAVRLAPEGAAGLQVSVDGGKSWGTLASLTVAEGTGRRPARADDVTHVRWTIPAIAPGGTGTVEYHAIVR